MPNISIKFIIYRRLLQTHNILSSTSGNAKMMPALILIIMDNRLRMCTFNLT
jgi:hypothetical protein